MGKDTIEMAELMGSNVIDKLKYCGSHVNVYPLAKIIHPECAELDDHVGIYDNVWIDAKPSLKIGKYSVVVYGALIEGWGNKEIGQRVFIGPGAKILASTTVLNGHYGVPMKEVKGAQEVNYGGVKICDDAYIGAGSVVMPGVTIGEGAVVGANSFVARNLKPWGIYFGNPCKLIGMREKPSDELKAKVEELDWTSNINK